MIEFDQLLLSSIGGATVTILINRFIQHYEKNQNLKRQTKIFVKFIDDIILKYLKINIELYEKLLFEIANNQDLFLARNVTESPMLNRTIFEFFDKTDLVKIFGHCKKNSLVDIYHHFYEIDFLQENSPQKILDGFSEKMLEHYNEHKKGTENFREHLAWCDFYQRRRRQFKESLETQRNHSRKLAEEFEGVRNELLNIDELNDDKY